MTNCFSIISVLNFLFINTTNTYRTISCVVNMLIFFGKAIVIALSSKYCIASELLLREPIRMCN